MNRFSKAAATAAGSLAAVLLSATAATAQTSAPIVAGPQEMVSVEPEATTHTAASDDSSGSDDIVVIGDNGNAFRLTADSLRDAVRAFRQHRASFAPNATLYVVVETADDSSLDDLSLYLRSRRRGPDGDREFIDLPLDARHRAVLPLDQVATGNWELRANRSRGGIRIRPQVLSPGSEIADRRFGDMRLQCRVAIAFARLSLPVRMLAGAVGPCGSDRVNLVTRAPQPLSAVSITGYALPIDIRPDRQSYVVPLSDESISNEARMRLTYR